jgi:hypothetical protein
MKGVIIGESLQARAFPNGKVSNRAIGAKQHVFATRHAMHASL